MAKKIELLHTTYDKSGNIESQEVVHPLTSSDCVIMENGETLADVMGDGIATPTLTHEGTSFKVGVGDSNIEVVDGDVAGMTLKGQSYQNILPKPTTLIMETDEQEFKINDKIDSNIIIDDNIAEIATVKGLTYVNTVQEESGDEYTVLGEDLSGQSIVTTNKPEGNIKGVTLQGQTLVNTIQEPCEDEYVVLGADEGNLAYETIIKPSTLYTIRFKHNTVNTDNPLTVDLGGTVQEVTSTEFTITTPSELTHNQLVFSGKNNVVSEVQVIEGDVTNIEYPFFEGMSDVKFSDSKFVGRGKNLFNCENEGEINGLTFSNNGANNYTVSGTCTKDNTDFYAMHRDRNSGTFTQLNSLPIGTTITVSKSSSVGRQVYFSIRQKDGSPTIYTQTYTTTNNDDAIHCFIRFMNGDTFDNEQLNLQIELGSTATSYESYKGVKVQQDVDSIPLTSDMFEQKNIDGNNIVKGMSYQQIAKYDDNTRISSKTIIPVKPNTTYSILNNTNIKLWYMNFDKNGGFICNGVEVVTQFTTTSDTHYIVAKILYNDDSTITPSTLDSMNLILQEVPQEIVLRGIGDVKDELDLTRGEYIQRVQQVVLDGSDDEAWVQAYGDSNPVMTIWLDIPNKTGGVSGRMVCDKLSVGKEIYSGDTNLGICFVKDTNELFKNIRIRTQQILNGQTVDSFKSWLQQNPITVQYVLETPIIHKVNLANAKIIPSYATETHYETITPSDSLIPNITIPSTLNYDVAIKPSTEYTIRANTQDALTVDLGGTTGTLSNGKVTLTTPATLTHNEVKFSGIGKVKELMVVEGNEIKDNVPFFNGMKDVQMGGIKLVNIARGATCNGLVTANTNKTQFTYTGDGTNWGDILFDKSLLKQNTLYTIYVNVISSNSDNANPLKISMGDDLNTWLNVSSTGLFKQTFTTNDNIDNLFGINFRPCTSGQKVVIENPMVIEGDWTHLDEIPFIESEMIIDQPIIRSQGKNLLDLESKYFNPSNVTYTKSGTTYTVVGNTSNYNYGQFAWTTETSAWFRNSLGKEVTLSVSSISCTNANSKACIQVRIACSNDTRVYKTISTNDDAKYETFTIPSNAIDMALQLMSNNTGSPLDSESTLTVSNIQLEWGDTATSYEPYKHQTLYSNRVIGYEENCYYSSSTGTKIANGSYASVKADVEGLSVAYVTGGSSNYSFYDKDDVYISGRSYPNTATTDNRNGFIIVPSNAKYMRFACGNVNDVYTPYTKATATGELPLRSLPNGVCDTLNLVTGEYVQRVGEIVLDGSEENIIYNNIPCNWILEKVKNTTATFYSQIITNNSIGYDREPSYIIANNFIEISNVFDLINGEQEGINNSTLKILRINILKQRLSSVDVDGFKQYLSQNPITVQYELATPIVRKLGFTTKGNYTEFTMDETKTWRKMDKASDKFTVTRYACQSNKSYKVGNIGWVDNLDFISKNMDGEGYDNITTEFCYIMVDENKLSEDTIDGFKQWLSQNPTKASFLTNQQSSDSYSNIHKPIFFNNVDVQYLPNNVDIQPVLTLQARTRNSYVMDMMKANTKYSLKLLTSSGNMKIDGISYTLANNRTFISPSTLTNKELIILGGWYEPMIIEGDVTGKNLPYFKGILSSYHDVDEIELYSVNKNLFDMSKVKPYDKSGKYWWNTIVKENEVVSVRMGDINNGQFGAYIKLDVRPSSTYTLYVEMEKDGEPFNGQIYVYENGDLWGVGSSMGYGNSTIHVRTTSQAKYITIGLNYGKDFPTGTTIVSKNVRLYLGEESIVYIPHAHSTTLIEMPTRLETVKVVRPVIENGSLNQTTGANYDDGDALVKNIRTKDYLPVQPGEIIKFYNNGQGRAVNIHYYDINKQFIKYEFYDGTSTRPTVPKDCYFVRMYCGKSTCSDITLTKQAWKPIQLNSLPNGVCDEIIMKPNSNKAQLVQRVGKVVLDGSENWWVEVNKGTFNKFVEDTVTNKKIQSHMYVDNLTIKPTLDGEQNNTIRIGASGKFVFGKDKPTANSLKDWLRDNPITVYYELATPIIHEIQLKGYPTVYENGTVTLNTDTPHKTLVSYNVNQEQLINTQNETIIRHDQQIDDLYYYIEMYLEEIYQMELFRMKLELSL